MCTADSLLSAPEQAATSQLPPVKSCMACCKLSCNLWHAQQASITGGLLCQCSKTKHSAKQHSLQELASRWPAVRHCSPCQSAFDNLQIPCEDLGYLWMVRVSHDNSGSHPGWCLEAIRVRRQVCQGCLHVSFREAFCPIASHVSSTPPPQAAAAILACFSWEVLI